jgi:transcriptional regulator with XRE-family HTH domain
MPLDQTRRQELAHFLRSRRERLDPAEFTIAPGARRRAVGLRREEVAQEAGISTTWYVWLEQGRNVNASAQVLRALGKALRLGQSEQAYLFQLARPDLDWRGSAVAHAMPTDSLLALVEGLTPHPAYVVNRYSEVVAINKPARLLLGEFSGDARAASVIGRMFLDPLWRQRFVDWPTVARSMVAQFRLRTASMTSDPVLASLVSLLEASSEDFARWWRDRELAEPAIWRKSLRLPVVGEMSFDFAAFKPGGVDGDFSVSIYTPADRTSRNRLARLLTSRRSSRA